MLRILGGPKRTCDGVTRRDLLRAGPLALLTGSATAAPAAGAAKAKNVILLYLFGGPSQLDTFDPKPDAPAEVRGDVKAIRTTVPGIDVCEHPPRRRRDPHRPPARREPGAGLRAHGLDGRPQRAGPRPRA